MSRLRAKWPSGSRIVLLRSTLHTSAGSATSSAMASSSGAANPGSDSGPAADCLSASEGAMRDMACRAGGRQSQFGRDRAQCGASRAAVTRHTAPAAGQLGSGRAPLREQPSWLACRAPLREQRSWLACMVAPEAGRQAGPEQLEGCSCEPSALGVDGRARDSSPSPVGPAGCDAWRLGHFRAAGAAQGSWPRKPALGRSL